MKTMEDKKKPKLFVWKKKIELHLSQGLPLRTLLSKKRKTERTAELQQLRKRRNEREIERAKREEERREINLARDSAQFHDWEKRDKEFELSQNQLRCEIRLRHGRPKPIDLMLNHLRGVHNNSPLDEIKSLTLEEIKQLHDDLQTHLEVDRSHTQYWESLLVICEWELTKLLGGDKIGLHSSIQEDVDDLLQGKSFYELGELQSEIETNMICGTAMVVEYWEALLKRLHVYKARSFLNDNYAPKNLNQQPLVGTEKSEQISSIRHIEDKEEDGDEWLGLKKPKYLNRVISGYDWNQYNRTHYDHDGPPPKLVQGYKFNIFYPDLVCSAKTPSYTVVNDEGDGADTCVIRFHAGAPYEDIAFRIVNKEWDYSRKKGFKCTFEKGISCLHFNFKRYRYRR